MSGMGRREFVALLGGAATWPLAARAQQPAMPVIGWLNSESPDGAYGRMADAFRQGLSETGFVDGRNVSIEYRWAQSQSDRLAFLAAELVHRQVAAIAAAGTASALAATSVTTTVPIVFSTATDPVAMGLVASLNRPGGNVTGVTNLGTELVQKQLEMLHRMVPSATIMTALINPRFPVSETQSRDLDVAARKLGLELHILHASTEQDLDGVFAKMVQLRAGALVVPPDAFFLSRHEQIVGLATRHSLPSIFPWREGAIAGGLMSYDVSVKDGYRMVGIYVGRILKGEQPGNLPVQELTKFNFAINLKTAKTLGLDVPLGLSAAADELIE
jgi:putative tryptophan/tyrosine transport system substrate-binding protein